MGRDSPSGDAATLFLSHPFPLVFQTTQLIYPSTRSSYRRGAGQLSPNATLPVLVEPEKQTEIEKVECKYGLFLGVNGRPTCMLGKQYYACTVRALQGHC